MWCERHPVEALRLMTLVSLPDSCITGERRTPKHACLGLTTQGPSVGGLLKALARAVPSRLGTSPKMF
jgi:hypothetical protein